MTADASGAPTIRAVGVISKRTEQALGPLVTRIERGLLDRGMTVLLDRECTQYLGRGSDGLARRAMVGKVDLIVCLGGDGTFLSVARRFAAEATPILGLNLGQTGFLMEVEPDDFERALDEFLAGERVIRERLMLESFIEDGSERRELVTVLNDVVITKTTLARMLDFDLFVGGELVTRYRGDGLIIATPTGSTAYSLAAGGPIVVPSLDAIVITPICPNALSERPILVPASSEIRVRIRSGEDAYLSLDGQVGHPLPEGREVVVRRAPHAMRLVHDPRRTFYDVLRIKLGWGGADQPRMSSDAPEER